MNSNHKEDRREHREILNAIKEEGRLNNTKATLISDLLSKDLFEGRIQDFDNLAAVVRDKSDDLELFYECLSQILRSERCTDATKRINEISDSRIRDNAVRTALPILLFRKEPIDRPLPARSRRTRPACGRVPHHRRQHGLHPADRADHGRYHRAGSGDRPERRDHQHHGPGLAQPGPVRQ